MGKMNKEKILMNVFDVARFVNGYITSTNISSQLLNADYVGVLIGKTDIIPFCMHVVKLDGEWGDVGIGLAGEHFLTYAKQDTTPSNPDGNYRYHISFLEEDFNIKRSHTIFSHPAHPDILEGRLSLPGRREQYEVFTIPSRKNLPIFDKYYNLALKKVNKHLLEEKIRQQKEYASFIDGYSQ
jgi:hypothetical protein